MQLVCARSEPREQADHDIAEELQDRRQTVQAIFGISRHDFRSPAAVLQQPLAEVTQHAEMEAGIVELEAERVLEVDPAPHLVETLICGDLGQRRGAGVRG
jgi:hypothetical protein